MTIIDMTGSGMGNFRGRQKLYLDKEFDCLKKKIHVLEIQNQTNRIYIERLEMVLKRPLLLLKYLFFTK